MLQVLFVASECAPFAKSGGLADIASSLPKELIEEGINVSVIMPKYGFIPKKFKNQMKKVASFNVALGWRYLYCGLEELEYENVHYYFIDNEYYFNRDGLYGYEDDAERFAFFSKAVLETIASTENIKPDIIHCNDWHTALVPLFFNELYAAIPYFSNIKTVFTIHNIKHQGNVEVRLFDDLLGLTGHSAAWGELEYYGRLNFMKAGILASNRVTTVSPNYAEEIKSGFYGEGLDPIINLRSGDLSGIINGVPFRKLPFYKNGDHSQIMPKKLAEFKAANKAELQEWMGLPVRPDVPVVGLVTRFVEQKGIDLITYIMHELLQGDTQFVFLGAGDEKYENSFRYFAELAPDKFAIRTAYDETLADKIYMGSDIFLVPSLFEPCGLTQMMAMEFGTIPVVRETGGLKDTVIAYNEYTGEGNGFSFANFNAHELLSTLSYALSVYWDNKKAWSTLTQTAAATDFTWSKSAKEYKKLYEGLEVVKLTTW